MECLFAMETKEWNFLIIRVNKLVSFLFHMHPMDGVQVLCLIWVIIDLF
jgi:hypothetical protein